MDKKQDQIQQPITWRCACGWHGFAEQMTKPNYTCPKCGEFKAMHVMLQLRENPLRAANLAA